MLYHPGKILEIIKKGKTGMLVLEMWDENLFTLEAKQEIISKAKLNSIVLVDYSPISEKLPVPKQKIVKILDKKQGEKIWKIYKQFLKKKKLKKQIKLNNLKKNKIEKIGEISEYLG